MSKFNDPVPPVQHECPKCHQVLQPLANGIPHHCAKKSKAHVCSNCGQWQHGESLDCLNQCRARGFVA